MFYLCENSSNKQMKGFVVKNGILRLVNAWLMSVVL